MVRAVKVGLIFLAVVMFGIAGGAVNLNLAVWRHGDNPALFIDFFVGMAVCLAVGLAVGGMLARRLLKKEIGSESGVRPRFDADE